MSRLTAEACAVILVNYNNAADTLTCIRALNKLRTPPAYIIVVDNGSRTEELTTLREVWQKFCDAEVQCCTPATGFAPPLRHILLQLDENTGFAGGNNAALRLLLKHTDCMAFWLLNNDTEPEPDALDTLCARLNARPDAGLCGSTLLFAATPQVVQCAGGAALSLWTGATYFICGLAPLAQVRSMAPDAVESQLGEITGASLLIRRAAVEKAGLMDERYFLYREDSEWSLRCRRAGFALAWARDSMVFHKEGGSSGAHSARGVALPVCPPFVDYLSVRNRIFLLRTYAPLALPVVLASLVGVYLNRVRRGQADRLGLIMRAAWHGLIGRMGKPKAC